METEVKNDPVVAIAGVTGAVGAEFIATMDKRGIMAQTPQAPSPILFGYFFETGSGKPQAGTTLA